MKSVSGWAGKRIVVIGLARQGKALVRYLSDQGAQVVLSDLKSVGELQGEMTELGDLQFETVLGEHPLTLLEGTETVFLSGGVPADIPLAIAAREQGIEISNDAELFLSQTPATVIGITGSAGKTTTTSLVARMAEIAFAGSGKSVWLGGNIGRPLLIDMNQMKAGDVAVMELSSFQLELMNSSPEIAAILNLTPDHLDRHGTMENYIQAKKRILEHQRDADWAIMNHDDPTTWQLCAEVKGRLVGFGEEDPGTEHAAYIEQGELMLRFDTQQNRICGLNEIRLRGKHNQLNLLAACALSAAAGVHIKAMSTVARTFDGVPHRLEFVREIAGVDWYNDSIATTPARALAAVRAFNEPIILLLGGHDKSLPWEPFFQQVLTRVENIVLFGEVGPRFATLIQGIQGRESKTEIKLTSDLEEAVATAKEIAKPGMVVLRSPGCTSFDEFENYEARGERFMQLVRQL